MYQPRTTGVNEAYYENDPYNFDEEIVVQHETHRSVYNPKKHNLLAAQNVQDIHKPKYPAREVSEMHDYSEEAKQVLKIFKSLEPEIPDSEEEYLNRFRAVAPEVFEGMEQQERNQLNFGVDNGEYAKRKRNLIFSSIGGEKMRRILRKQYAKTTQDSTFHGNVLPQRANLNANEMNSGNE